MNYLIQQPDALPERADLLALWKRNLPAATEGRFAWLYADGAATNWFVSTPAGELVGATGLMRRPMKLGPLSVVVGNAIDLNVDKEHRTIGPAVQLQRALTASLGPRAIPLVYAMPSREACVVLKRIGYKQVGWMERWAKPLQSQYKLSATLRSQVLGKLVGHFVDGALWLRSAEFTYRRPADFTSALAEGFDRRFEQLWNVSSRHFAIVGARTPKYLDWRYTRCPDVDYQIFTVADADGSLIGYVVYYLADRQAYVSDLFFADSVALHILLGEFVQHARDAEAQSISLEFFGNAEVARALTAYGFSKRQQARPVLVYVNQREAAPHFDQLLNSENWYLTKADSDTDI